MQTFFKIVHVSRYIKSELNYEVLF